MLGSELFLFEKNFWRLATFFLEFQNSSDDVGEQSQANVSDEHVKEISDVCIKIHLSSAKNDNTNITLRKTSSAAS